MFDIISDPIEGLKSITVILGFILMLVVTVNKVIEKWKAYKIDKRNFRKSQKRSDSQPYHDID